MRKREVVLLLKERLQLDTITEATRTLDAIVDIIKESTTEHEVIIPGFGKFYSRKLTGRSEGKIVPKFIAFKEFKQKVRG
jgi:nucleoid DNA-binding protein